MSANPENPCETRCPRCGYDLRGAVATWADSCPLEGTCAECGLVYRWAEVLQPHRYEPPWCVEFAAPAQRIPMACMRTLVRSMWPWHFWSRLAMAQRMRPGRLVEYLLFLSCLLPTGYVAVQTSAAIVVRLQIQAQLDQSRSQMTTLIADLRRQIGRVDSDWPYITHEQRDQIRAPLQKRLSALLQRQQLQTPVIKHSYTAAIAEAVFTPWASTSSGTIGYSGGITVTTYPAPIDLYGSYMSGGVVSTVLGPDYRVVEAVIGASPLLLAGLSQVILVPTAFILLPVSRRRARVRWSHIARVTAYSMWVPAAVLTLLTVVSLFGATSSVIGGSRPIGPSACISIIYGLSAFGVSFGLIVWWWPAIERYLRIRHAFPMAVLLTSLAWVVVCATLYFLAQDYFINLID